MVCTYELIYDSKGNSDIIDVTGDVQDAISKSQLKDGQALVFTPGATASVTTVEPEEGLLEDVKGFFEKIIPQDATYAHHDDNGHSHVRAALLGPSEIIPFKDSKLILGTWQNIVVVDFDTRARRRRVIVQLMGE